MARWPGDWPFGSRGPPPLPGHVSPSPSSRSNYFGGSNLAGWHTDVTQYAQVAYQDLYPGIGASPRSAA